MASLTTLRTKAVQIETYKNKSIKLNAINKHREKKRRQKLLNKQQEVSSDRQSIISREETTSKNPSGEEDSVLPQKRKGTIWKILFPDKKSEKHGTELERLVCRQVEYQISK